MMATPSSVFRVGEAIEFLPFFVFAVLEAGQVGLGSRIDERRGRCEAQTIESLNGWDDPQPTVIYTAADEILTDTSVIVSAAQLCQPLPEAGRCSLRFLTPTRLRLKGQLSDQLPFDVLLRALMRRVSAMAYYYCGTSLFFSPADLLEAAAVLERESSSLQWFDWERGSRRQGRRFQMGGVLGTVVYRGEFSPFVEFLRAGEYLHVGKGVSVGLGKFRIG
jgi:hypothetical protein